MYSYIFIQIRFGFAKHPLLFHWTTYIFINLFFKLKLSNRIFEVAGNLCFFPSCRVLRARLSSPSLSPLWQRPKRESDVLRPPLCVACLQSFSGSFRVELHVIRPPPLSSSRSSHASRTLPRRGRGRFFTQVSCLRGVRDLHLKSHAIASCVVQVARPRGAHVFRFQNLRALRHCC